MDLRKWLRPPPRHPTADTDTPVTTTSTATISENRLCRRAKRITLSVACFIAKDLRPYSVVENAGFRHLLKTIEPRYKLPTRATFTDSALPALYKETKCIFKCILSDFTTAFRSNSIHPICPAPRRFYRTACCDRPFALVMLPELSRRRPGLC
jgi:hypothetical protein